MERSKTFSGLKKTMQYKDLSNVRKSQELGKERAVDIAEKFGLGTRNEHGEQWIQ